MSVRPNTRPNKRTIPGVGNRRSLERFELHTEIFIEPLDERYPSRWVMSSDITHEGIFIRSGSAYPLDALISLTIHTLHGDIEVTGQVVHRIGGVGFGCRFVELSERSKSRLSFLVSHYYAAPPARRKIN